MSQSYELSTLYKLNAAGKIYQWKIWVAENSSGDVTMYTQNGTYEGKQVQRKRNIPRGKLKLTKFEQGCKEADSKWRGKVEKEGYRETLPTEEDKIVRPMLAHTYKLGDAYKGGRGKKIVFPAYVQPKFDGLRCIAYKEGKHVVLETRNGKHVKHLDHIRADLMNFFSVLGDRRFYFDGELYSHTLPFETINGLCRSKTFNAEEEAQSKLIHYYIYDCFDLDKPKMTNQDRFKLIHGLFEDMEVHSLRISPTHLIKNEEEMKEYHTFFVQEGYEGTMLRNLEGPYEINKRSKNLQKYKQFLEEEFTIVGYHEEEGGMVVWDCVTSDGKPFACRPRGTEDYRRQLLETADKFIGADLTVIFQEYTKDNVPRFPVGKAIRWDK